MEKIQPQADSHGLQRTVGGLTESPELSLLLVTRNPEWYQAVHGATRSLGHVDILNCGARDALARLAGTASHYSHLLVDRDDADGLLNELADVATEVAAPETDVFVLGSSDESSSHLRSITTATAPSVLAALLAPTLPSSPPVMEPAELRAALTGALIENRYQPIVRVLDRRPVGLEALVRMNHPKKGRILPDIFVPQIERAGLSADLTVVVCSRAFGDLAGPLLSSLDLRIAVNFPLDVLLMPSALERLEAQREASGLAPDRIIIELTESRPVDDFPRLRRALDYLRGHGYGVAIDDISPAMPHVTPLLDLPFTRLKLDKALVREVADCDAARCFIGSVTATAQANGQIVTAEGVETQQSWDHMAALGVDEVQGFVAARPLPVAAVPIWWEAWVG